jgi:hypothetical protein
MRGRWSLFIAGAVLIALALPAYAAPRPNGRHCAVRLVPVSRRGSVIEASPQLIGCFATLHDALEAGSDGSIQADVSSPADLTDEMVQPQTLDTNVLIGTEFNHTSYGGDSTDYFAPTACAGTDVWEFNYVGDALNDTFSSGKGFGGCDHNKKFQDADFGGTVLTCTPNCSDYGSLSNQVSSLRYRP